MIGARITVVDQRQQQADDSAEAGEHHRLDQELHQHLARRRAPMARRMPISRVRSVTDTSMMFMMPMPPTIRLTAATARHQPRSGSAVVPCQRLGDLAWCRRC